MKRETLREYLYNRPLVRAIKENQEIQRTKKELDAARLVMCETNMSEAAQNEIEAKIKEYTIISRQYEIMIEDTWGVTWQKESIIRQYIDCGDEEIDCLPDTIRVP